MRKFALISLLALVTGCEANNHSWPGGRDTDTGDTDPTCAGTCSDDDGDGFAETEGDCNDANDAVHPGAAEVCNGLDDNCRNGIDEGGVCDDPVDTGDTDTTGPGNEGTDVVVRVELNGFVGESLCLDAEFIYDAASAGNAWVEDWMCGEVVDASGVVTFSLQASDGLVAFRGDVDLPGGGNTCVGYDETATIQYVTTVTLDGTVHGTEEYSEAWQEVANGPWYYGCSFIGGPAVDAGSIDLEPHEP